MTHTTLKLCFLMTVAVVSQSKKIYSGEPFCTWPTGTANLYQSGPATWDDRCFEGNSVPGLECWCIDGEFRCPGDTDGQPSDIEYCKHYCKCDIPREEEITSPSDTNSQDAGTTVQNPPSPDEITSPWATCSTSCKKLDDCGQTCKCKTSLWSSLFWFGSGSCAKVGTPFHDGLRARQIAVSNSTYNTAAGGRQVTGGNVAQIASIKEAYACNESYVSVACGSSVDGIVHEEIENWLGALVPDGSDPNNPPPIPQDWLTAHNAVQSNPNSVMKRS